MFFLNDTVYHLAPECTERWTREAIRCYNLKGDCTKCTIAYNYETINQYNCLMKYCVQELLYKYGKPKGEEENAEMVDEQND